MSYLKRNVKISPIQIQSFLKKGYSLKEIVIKGISLKIISKIITKLKYNFIACGKSVDIDYRAVIDGCNFIKMGNGLY